jgi:hypothetical protein
MKNILITTALVFMAVTFSNGQGKLNFYQIEEFNYACFANFAPHTQLEYYSNPGGGKLLHTIATDATGYNQSLFPITATPSFTLNRKSPENQNGTNLVYDIDKKDFVVKNIKTDILAQQFQITWEAQISNGADVDFQILKSVNNAPFEIIKTIHGSNGTSMINYEFKVQYATNDKYKIVIIQDNHEVRYSSSILKLENLSTRYRVYPTATNGILFIDQQTEEPISFKIITLTGNVIQYGNFNNRYNKIVINQAIAGPHQLIITNPYGQSQSFPFFNY